MFEWLFTTIMYTFDTIVDPMYSFAVDGVSLYQWAFIVFLGCCLVRFVLPLLGLDGSGLSISKSFGDSPDPKVSVQRRSDDSGSTRPFA